MKKLKNLIRHNLLKIPFVKTWKVNREFHIERALINNESIDASNRPSVIHYSLNKAATMYTKRVMLTCAQENELLPVRMSDYAWVRDFPYIFTLSADEVKQYHYLFRPRGFIYSVFGGLVEGIPNLENYRTVVMIRDPRDVLVSAFFSYSKSHAIPETPAKAEEFLQLRARINEQGIDAYVLEAAEELRMTLQKYIDLRKTNLDVCLLKYEDMIADFPAWLDQLLAYCQWEISASLRDKLISEARGIQGKVKKEDPTNHHRQGTPGDYKRKLQEQTVNQLNEKLASVLSELGYTPS